MKLKKGQYWLVAGVAHRYGPGKVHLLDRSTDKSWCGRWVYGTEMIGTLDLVECKSCRKKAGLGAPE